MNESDLDILAKTSPAFRTRALAGVATTMEVGYGAPRPMQSTLTSSSTLAGLGLPLGHPYGAALTSIDQQFFQQQRNLQLQQYMMGAQQQSQQPPPSSQQQQQQQAGVVRSSLMGPMTSRSSASPPQTFVQLPQGYPSMLGATSRPVSNSGVAPSSANLYAGQQPPPPSMFGYHHADAAALQAAMCSSSSSSSGPPTPSGLWSSALMPPLPALLQQQSQALQQQNSTKPLVVRSTSDRGATTSKPKRRSPADESGDESVESAISEGGNNKKQAAEGVPATRKPKRARQAAGGDSDEANLNGEQRLMIVFDSFGRLSKHPQKMGRKQGFIPDGVSGTFSMYGEAWGFEVRHEGLARCDDGEERVCIRWTICNKVSGVTHSVVETPADAMKRDIRGVSLCNKVFVHAMELRAREYEVLVEKEKQAESPNMLKVSNYRSRAQCLRPQRFSEGPLLFGLRHKCVQDNMIME